MAGAEGAQRRQGLRGRRFWGVWWVLLGCIRGHQGPREEADGSPGTWAWTAPGVPGGPWVLQPSAPYYGMPPGGSRMPGALSTAGLWGGGEGTHTPCLAGPLVTASPPHPGWMCHVPVPAPGCAEDPPDELQGRVSSEWAPQMPVPLRAQAWEWGAGGPACCSRALWPGELMSSSWDVGDPLQPMTSSLPLAAPIRPRSSPWPWVC